MQFILEGSNEEILKKGQLTDVWARLREQRWSVGMGGNLYYLILDDLRNKGRNSNQYPMRAGNMESRPGRKCSLTGMDLLAQNYSEARRSWEKYLASLTSYLLVP